MSSEMWLILIGNLFCVCVRSIATLAGSTYHQVKCFLHSIIVMFSGLSKAPTLVLNKLIHITQGSDGVPYIQNTAIQNTETIN